MRLGNVGRSLQWVRSNEEKSRYEVEIQHGETQRNNESIRTHSTREHKLHKAKWKNSLLYM